jgi:DNA-binding NtrC family response regulator
MAVQIHSARPNANGRRSRSPSKKPTDAPQAMPTLLIVDDEAPMRRSLRRCLADEGYRILEASSAEEALKILSVESVHVVLSDHNMPGMCGLDLLRTIRLRHPKLVRMIVTANREFDTAVRAINLGEVSRFVCKPWNDDELACSVRQAFEQAALERELRKLRAHAKRTVDELRTLEQRHPGITTLRRDGDGAIVVEEIGDDGAIQGDAIWKD